MNKPVLAPTFCSTNGILITSVQDEQIQFGMLDLENLVLKKRVEKAFNGYRCVFSLLGADEFNLLLSRLFAAEQSDSDVSKQHENKKNDFTSEIDQIADDAPVINLLNSIFLEAISRKASDIHIEFEKENVQIRFRVDGILFPINPISLEKAAALSARLKLLAHLNVLETRKPQDGHIDVKAENYSVDVRISITPTIWGESIVLRLLNRSDVPYSLETLGFSAGHRRQLDAILSLASGLILVTGPTGSGKTTTLATILKILNTKERKIISLEDPVEYRIAGISQIQINEELGLTFDTLLRRVFRQDPDIIMVGEIRDTETAELAVRAALTGHVVFATLHTADAVEAIYRLQNMGIPPYLVASVLQAVIAQRLVRRICTKCHAEGCSSCSGTGYSGRIVVSEMLQITRALAGQISDGAVSGKLRKFLEKSGHKTLFDDAKEKVALGVTSQEEIRRELGIEQTE